MNSIVFLSVRDVLEIHNRVIEDFGGDSGLRDRGLLESAVAMPHSMFSGCYLHTDLAEMAAAYHFHLCANHPFVDGNKRVAVATAEVFLLVNSHELVVTDRQLEELTQGLAAGLVSKGQVVDFFRNNVEEI